MRVLGLLFATALIAGCQSSNGGDGSRSSDPTKVTRQQQLQAKIEAIRRELSEAAARCFEEAKRTFEPPPKLVTDPEILKEFGLSRGLPAPVDFSEAPAETPAEAAVSPAEPAAAPSEGTFTTFRTCQKREYDLIDLKYDLPNTDLQDFYHSYLIAIARRQDAGLITQEQAEAEGRRVEQAVNAESQRRLQAAFERVEQLQAEERRARSLEALALGLGIVLRSTPQPPPSPQTTIYNFPNQTVVCNRWNNVIDCF